MSKVRIEIQEIESGSEEEIQEIKIESEPK